jgi:hypothetical protein
MMDQTEALFQASLTSAIRELIVAKQSIDEQILRLVDELNEHSWYADLMERNTPNDYRMD